MRSVRTIVIGFVCLYACLVFPRGTSAVEILGGVPWPQKDARVAVTTVWASEDRSFRSFMLVNNAEKKVVLVQLGWVVRSFGSQQPTAPLDPTQSRLVLKGVSFPHKVTLLPGLSARYSLDALSGFPLAEELQRRVADDKVAIIIFGVVMARFEDDSEWRYDLVNSPDWDPATNLPPESYGLASRDDRLQSCCGTICTFLLYCAQIGVPLECCPCGGACTTTTFCGNCQQFALGVTEEPAETYVLQAVLEGS